MLNKGSVTQKCANNLDGNSVMHGINVLLHYPTSGSNLILKCDPIGILGDGI